MVHGSCECTCNSSTLFIHFAIPLNVPSILRVTNLAPPTNGSSCSCLQIFATFTWPNYIDREPYSALSSCTCPRISQSKTNRFASQTISNSPRMFDAQSFDFKALFNKYSLHNNTYLIYGRPFQFYSPTFRYLNIFIIKCEMRTHCIVYQKMTVKMEWAQSGRYGDDSLPSRFYFLFKINWSRTIC